MRVSDDMAEKNEIVQARIMRRDHAGEPGENEGVLLDNGRTSIEYTDSTAATLTATNLLSTLAC